MNFDPEKFNQAVPEPPTPGGSIDEHATETQLAALVKAQLPPVKCVGGDWYVYEKGLWKRGSRNIHRPIAINVQNVRSRTERTASNVLSHIESEAQVDEESFASFHKFDGDAVLVNCASCVLRVTGSAAEQLEHDPKYLFTGQLAARYEANAKAPTFGRVLQESLPDPEDLQLFLLFAGYILLPDCRHELVLVCFGDTGTGKSTIADGIRAVLGPDLVRALSLPQICDPKTFHLSQLRNAALNLCTELDTLPILDSNNFKLLASGEPVSADRKYRDLITFAPTCKHLFLSNHLPKFHYGTDAELRRLRFLRFDRKPPKPDRSLKQKVAAERDGIFALMICALQQLLDCREIPEGGKQSRETKARFRVINNPITVFVEERCVLDPAQEITKDDLFGEYVSFLDSAGVPAPSDKATFFRELYNRYESIVDVRRRIGGDQVPKCRGIELRAQR